MVLRCRALLLIILMMIFSLACSAPSLYEHTASTDNETEEFVLAFNPENCELPCVWGITPGQTEISEALDIIASTVPDEQIDPAGTFWILDSGENQIFIELHQSGPQNVDFVSQITVSTPYSGSVATLGDFLDNGYQPTQVFRGNVNPLGGINLLIAFDRNDIVVGLYDTQISPESPITILYSLDPDLSESLLGTILTVKNFQEISWIGFASVEDYLDLPSPPK